MTPETFDVWEHFDGDLYDKSLEGADAKTAVEYAKALTCSVAAQLGILHKVQIVDSTDDCTVFLWEYDRGLIFPTTEDLRQPSR